MAASLTVTPLSTIYDVRSGGSGFEGSTFTTPVLLDDLDLVEAGVLRLVRVRSLGRPATMTFSCISTSPASGAWIIPGRPSSGAGRKPRNV